MPKKESPAPNFKPISALPLIRSMIVEQLRDNEIHYETLGEAREKPHVLDDEILDRTVTVHEEQLEFLGIYAEQLNRWSRERLSAEQANEVKHLAELNARSRKVCEAILALAAELKAGSIDRILEKDDLELGLEVLLGNLKPPRGG